MPICRHYKWILTFNIAHFHVWRLAKCERLSFMILYARPNELQSAGIGKSFACPVGTAHPWLSRCQTALPRNWERHRWFMITWGLGNCPIESLPPKHLNIKYPPPSGPQNEYSTESMGFLSGLWYHNPSWNRKGANIQTTRVRDVNLWIIL